MIDTVYTDILQRYPRDFTLALTAADIERAHRQHKIAGLLGMEGGHAIEDSPRLLRDYYRLGVRYMTLTHTNTNSWADSSGDMNKPGVEHHNGLTPLGKDIVHEMNRLGMMVDISHVADKTFYDALETSQAPLIASHSACRDITNVPRNMTDEMIKALAQKGGVVQVNFYCNFISQKSADAPRDAPVRATLADVVAHIDHISKLPASTPLASAQILTASNALLSVSMMSQSSLPLRARFWKKDIPPPISRKSTAATPCDSCGKSRRSPLASSTRIRRNL
jgi:microsomal dipeptidase-like Zn-dependent dipeptidase